MEYDVLILGGGVSGRMIAKRLDMVLPHLSKVIVDKRSDHVHGFHLHRPIPELKTDWETARFYLGVWNGKLKSSINVKDINAYSKKVTGKLSVTNIVNFTKQTENDIYPMKKDELYDLLKCNVAFYTFGCQFIDLGNGYVTTELGRINFKYLINTIPLPYFLKMADISHKLDFSFYPFFCASIPLGYSSKLHQMIYNTDPKCTISRATLHDSEIFVDMRTEQLTEFDTRFLAHTFCIDEEIAVQPARIPIGRFDAVGEERRHLFFYLNSFGVFCLGRYGAWTFKVANDVWEDTEKICSRINDKEYCSKGSLLCKNS
jgi:hypothetical protein